MARKASSVGVDSIDALIDKSAGGHQKYGRSWTEKISETGRVIVEKVAQRQLSSAAMLAVIAEVMEAVCPGDVQYIPSEGTMRKWLRDRRKSKAARK